jgi:SAM-dependent methyltransferase
VSLRGRIVESARRGLKQAATRSTAVHRAFEIGRREFDRALRDDWYDGAYFGDSGGGGLASQYEYYTRDSSNADPMAYILWRYLPATSSLDVGCAFGFVVEALREVGVDAKGVDTSQYAVEHALGARGHTQYGNLLYRLPFRRGSFELVTALETLEHLPPERVPHAIAELARVSSKWVVATIPSLGPNEFGPGGWLDAKVKPERLEHYRSLGDDYEGPVPYDDLFRDENGDPVEGHLTIASFAWWTKRFAEAGLVRCGDAERRMHPQIARFGMTKYWNLYVLRHHDAPEPPAHPIRTDAEIVDVEQRWRLERWRAQADDIERVRASCGAGCFEDVPLDIRTEGRG